MLPPTPLFPAPTAATAPADLRRRLLSLPDLSEADRAALNALFDKAPRYGLTWEDKPEAVEDTLRTHLPTLHEVPERALVAADAAAPAHALLEGDNLHALTVLNYTHAGQVDVIYIDPPYNTGNKDFRYNDSFVDREDGYRHSKWLSFMAKRLRLAKPLLKASGVIFISIDDNEQAQLRLLCDEIFGEENFVANVIWQSRVSPANDAKHLSIDHEYVLVYAKSKETWRPFKLARTANQIANYSNPDNDARGVWNSVTYTCNKSVEERPSLYYPVTNPKGVEVWPKRTAVWKYSKERHEENQKNGLIYWGKNGDSTTPRLKQFLTDMGNVVPRSIFTYDENGHTQEARTEILSVLENSDFTTPKPTRLIRRVLQVAADSNALILDFFAGSGTTLHATMALNAEDGGQRRCILVTNNENGIAEQVCYERNRRVIEGYTTPKGVAVAGLTANTLRYYRCAATVPRQPTHAHRRALVREAVDMLCFREGCFLPLPAPAGLPAPVRLFGAPDRALVVVLDDLAIDDAVAAIAALPVPPAAPAGEPWCAVYVFAPGAYPYTDDFRPVADRVRLVALPEALYRAWQHLLPVPGPPRAVPAPPPTDAASPTDANDAGDDDDDEYPSAAAPQEAADDAAIADAPRATPPAAEGSPQRPAKAAGAGTLPLF